MDLQLAGKTAVVSGGSKGIGREIVTQLASEGANVIAAARGSDALDELVRDCATLSGRVLPFTADMTQESEIQRAVDLATTTWGTVDIAVSNVYPQSTQGFESATDAQFLEEFRTMVMSVVHLTRSVLPHMRAQRGGRLINIGSVTMKGPTYGFPAILSHVTRPAVVGLNKSLANELGESGITVNNIAVGSIKTERARDAFQERTGQDAASFDQLERARVAELSIPLRRMGTPSEVASLAVFLASERGGYITGQTIAVDGGRTGGLY